MAFVRGMMRPGDKLASYRVLGRVLARLGDLPWQILVVGDGPVLPEVKEALATAVGDGDRIVYAGAQAEDSLARFYRAADLFVWPAVNEAYGMAILEAQAHGLPVVAGRSGGVPHIVRDRETGLIAAPDDPAELAAAVRELLADPRRRAAMATAAAQTHAAEFGFDRAVAELDAALGRLVARAPA